MKLLAILGLLLLWVDTDNKTFVLTMGAPPNCAAENNICNIQLQSVQDKNNQVACGLFKLNERTLSISIYKTSTSEVFYFNYLATGFFVVSNDYALNQDVVDYLSLSNLIVKAGKYPITVTALAYVVEVNIR